VLELSEISSIWFAVERPGITETLRLAMRFLRKRLVSYAALAC
jgi:hypothetical protein